MRPSPAGGSWLNLVSHLDPKFGGISAALPALCDAVVGAGGCDVSLAAFCGPDEEFRADGHRFAIERFPLGKRIWLQDGAERARLRASIRRSVGVHIHGLWQEHCLLGASMARTAGKPYLISAHGMLDAWALGAKRWKKAIYSALIENRNLRRASCLHALTDAEAEDYRRSGAKTPVVVIPNGVHIPKHGAPHAFLREFPHLEDKRIVLFLARLHPKKGLDLLCRAWAKVRRREEDHLVIAGPDFEGTRARMEQQIGELGIGDSVTFTGMLSGERKWGALRAAHVFTLPSYSEGLSVSVLEAMGLGVPVIVTRQCNVPDVVTAGCGWTVEPDETELTAALDDCLGAPQCSLQEMGTRGEAVVRARYSWEIVGRQMASVYEWLLGGAQPSSVDLRLQ